MLDNRTNNSLSAPNQHDWASVSALLPWLVLENTAVGIAYMRHRHFIWANARMAEIFGYAPEELNDQSVRVLYTCEEDYEAVNRLMQGNPASGFYTHERALLKKDGSQVWCKVSGRILEPGNPDSPSVWVVQDHSEKKQAVDALKRLNQQLEQTVANRTVNLRRTNWALTNEIERRRQLQELAIETREKYRALFRHLPIGALVANGKGEITEINRTLQIALGAVSPRLVKILSKDETRIRLPSGQQTSLAALIRYKANKTRQLVHRFAFTWKHPRGDQQELLAIAAPLANNKRGVVFTISDITEQKKQQQHELEQQAAVAHAARLSLMGEMATSLAHEIGQPLNASQSYLSGVRNHIAQHNALDKNVREELSNALDKASSHLEQAGQIVRNIRNFISQQQSEPSPIKIKQLIEQTLDLLELPLRSANVTVEIEFDKLYTQASPTIYGQAIEIQQVLINLIINAIDAMADLEPDKKRIDIRVFLRSIHELTLDIIDQGPGIPSKILPKLFDPYITTKKSGLGMGLMISRNIIEWHGGKLHLQSSPDGTCFRFTLPINDPRSSSHEYR